MKELIKAFDDLPLIVKVILCIPCLDIVWSVYKICKSADKSNYEERIAILDCI